MATRKQTRKRMSAHAIVAMHTSKCTHAGTAGSARMPSQNRSYMHCLNVGLVKDEEGGCVGADARLEADR